LLSKHSNFRLGQIPISKEKYNPCGIVDEDTGELFINFGSSYKTSDFIMDSLTDWWSPFGKHA